jgi:hypothetical protein
MDRGGKIPWVGGQMAWVKVSIYHGYGEIPWIESKYHGQGVQYTKGMGVKIPWIEGLIYHGIVYCIPYPWYINTFLWCYEPLCFGRNEGGQFTMGSK